MRDSMVLEKSKQTFKIGEVSLFAGCYGAHRGPPDPVLLIAPQADEEGVIGRVRRL